MALKKAELNRLQHEHAALLQQQEQLAQQLEHCVHRRQNLCEKATSGVRKPPPQSVSVVAKRKVKELQAAAVDTRKRAKAAGHEVANMKVKCGKLEQEASMVSICVLSFC
jgi:cell division septum initiation protein DivIVA